MFERKIIGVYCPKQRTYVKDNQGGVSFAQFMKIIENKLKKKVTDQDKKTIYHRRYMDDQMPFDFDKIVEEVENV